MSGYPSQYHVPKQNAQNQNQPGKPAGTKTKQLAMFVRGHGK